MAREEDVRKSLLKRLFRKASYKFGVGGGETRWQQCGLIVLIDMFAGLSPGWRLSSCGGSHRVQA